MYSDGMYSDVIWHIVCLVLNVQFLMLQDV